MTMRVAASNVQQAKVWDGGDGDYWTEQERIFDRSLAGYQGRFLAAARLGASERVLDIGCGTGQVTRDAARLAHRGAALGVDLSARMIERARKRAAEEGLANAEFVQADAQAYPFGATFDVAVSRTGAMFFGDPVAGFVNIAAALRPGGRLVLLNWQGVAQNPWFGAFTDALTDGRGMPPMPPDAPSPFALADPERVRDLLLDAGFIGVEWQDLRAPMYFGQNADEAHRFLGGMGVSRMLMRGQSDAERERALANLRAVVEERETPDGVFFPSATWLVMARRP
jgi:SAM-dependent methyltransferase